MHRFLLLISFFLHAVFFNAQTVSQVYKISDLLTRISNNDTLYIVNFWATWCKPCIRELQSFDSLSYAIKDEKIKVLLVSLDFIENKIKNVNPLLAKKQIKTECVLLDEINGNDFINKIDNEWSGSIPATLFKKENLKMVAEKKFVLDELIEVIQKKYKIDLKLNLIQQH